MQHTPHGQEQPNSDAPSPCLVAVCGVPASAAHRDVVDFNDALIKALALIRSGRLRERYAAVVIDEAHDHTMVGVRLPRAIAGGDSRAGLFLVGDGQQSVYPGRVPHAPPPINWRAGMILERVYTGT